MRVSTVLGFDGSADPHSGLDVEVVNLGSNIVSPKGAVRVRSKDGCDAVEHGRVQEGNG